MYVYEGEDYSKSSDEDKKSFDQLLAGTDSFKYHILIYFGVDGGEVWRIGASVIDTILQSS